MRSGSLGSVFLLVLAPLAGAAKTPGKAAAPLTLHLQVLPKAVARPTTIVKLTLHNPSAHAVLVQETASPGRGFYATFTDAQGRAIWMNLVSCEAPAVLPAEVVSLAPGRSLTREFAWKDQFRYRGSRPVVRRMDVMYASGDERDSAGRPIAPKLRVHSNGVWLSLSPDGDVSLVSPPRNAFATRRAPLRSAARR